MDPDAMEAIVTRLENKLRSGWRAAMREIKDSNALRELERKIASGDIAALVTGADEAIAAFTSDLAAGYVYAAQRAARAIDTVIDPRFRFDLVSDSAVEWMQNTARTIATDLIEEQNAAALRVVQYATARGATPFEIASEVQASIGLSQYQVDMVENYRAVLERGDYATARGYELRDARYDASLTRADEAGTFLGEERIDAMVGRYREGWVSFRADGIALEEAQDASHAGVEEAFTQAFEGGYIKSEPDKVWYTRGDARVRPTHVPMHGQRRRLSQTFMTGGGVELRYPGDENGPSQETGGCRCSSVVLLPGGLLAVQTGDDEFQVMKFEDWRSARDCHSLAA